MPLDHHHGPDLGLPVWLPGAQILIIPPLDLIKKKKIERSFSIYKLGKADSPLTSRVLIVYGSMYALGWEESKGNVGMDSKS